MYSPVPEVDESATNTTAVSKSKEENVNHNSRETALKALTITVWISGICFAVFATGHYVRHAWMDEWELWDLSDLHLYRPAQPFANMLMVTHLIGGSLLMLLGPIQLIPSIRRWYLSFHRWTGRIYVTTALVTALAVSTFVVLYRTSRNDVYEDVGNVVLGISMMICATQSYRHVRNGRIEQHKWWSYRLYALVLAALLYRLYVVVYFALILFTPWTGSRFIFESLFFLFFLPNLMLVQLYRQVPHTTRLSKVLYSASLYIAATIFIGFTTGLLIFYNWWPSLKGQDVGQASNIEHAYEN